MQQWRVKSWSRLATELMASRRDREPRPVILGIDGRSGSGKTTTGQRLAAEIPGAVVVHTDDLAWWESFFGWDGVLAAHLLLPVRQGGAVHYRPPAWQERGRPGAIDVPAGTPLLIVEGVGSTRVGLASLLDATIWVQSDVEESRRRGIARDGQDGQSVAFWEEWQSAERPFLDADRPWDRAGVVVCGTPELVAPGAIDPAQEVLTGSLKPAWTSQTSCRC